jgi:opacity protein-like surface antigen
MKIKWMLVLMAVCALTLSAADIAGTWKAAIETPNGSFESTFVFKVDGSKVTGATSNQMMGEAPISEGKIDGENLSFNVTLNRNGQEFKLNYKGKVAGNEIKLTVEVPGADRTFEMTAKKVS